ncbi:exonuclease V [Parachaetomium inaequale]|uniref:Exonuclease V n=1 Tax=Parachaetomium inaequale TaxID=2588326 RepID=A0AAN6PRS1_9PEZI|nr:exonuclease V [Parachaetomium inaequale]
MAGFASDTDSEYGYDLTASDEERLWAIADRLSAALSPQSRPAPATPAPRTKASTPARNTIASNPHSPELDPDTSLAIEETIAAITDDDLSFDSSELQDDDDAYGHGHGQGAAHVQHGASRNSTPESHHRRLAPSVAGDGYLASFISKTKPRSMPTLLPGPDVSYPDLSRALSDAQDAARSEKAKPKDSAEDNRSPLLRFRTFPMKPFSVSDLTAGSWCELQYFYTLTRLPGGRKTRTAAMKRGTKLHEKLERELFTPVQIDIAKKEDNFGLKIWNMIQGLRVLRDQGVTREFEVWGMVEGNLVCGVIDGLSYENPDTELQEDVVSSRGSSQGITNSQPYKPSTPGDYEIFITDVKTRNSATPPPQTQVRVSIIQLFLYHRFLSDMASDRLDYMRVFERYGLNADEPFSDSFMAQIGAVHDEVFTEADADSASTLSHGESTTDSNADFVSAPSSPSQLSFTSSTQPTLKYRTLRTLLPLLKLELAFTFPRGASDLGKIVAVEYRYRGRDPPAPKPTTATTNPDGLNPDETDPFPPAAAATTTTTTTSSSSHHRRRRQGQDPNPNPEPEPGSVICTNTFFVELETLDLFLSETMRWWKGERAPRGVALDEAGFKCRPCEFMNECDWRRGLDAEALGRARRRRSEREGGAGGVDVEGGMGMEGEMERGGAKEGGIEEIEEGAGGVGKEGVRERRGRPRKPGRDNLGLEVEVEEREGVKRARGRPKKLTAAW